MSDATFTLEIEWAFQDPQTGWQIDDLTITVTGTGDQRTGEIYGWEVTSIEQPTLQLDRAYKRVALKPEWPMVRAMLEILNSEKKTEGARFAAEVVRRAQIARRAA